MKCSQHEAARDMDAGQLIKALERIAYRRVRQTGSHIRLDCEDPVHALCGPEPCSIREPQLSLFP